jgi:hypothetical protein
MKRLLFVLFLAVGITVMGSGSALAALEFNLDFGQDGTYENYYEMKPSEEVFIDIYLSGLPSGVPNPQGIKGLGSMGIVIDYDVAAVEITPGTKFGMELMTGKVELDTPGQVKMSGADFVAILLGRDGHYGDDILVGTLEFHCIAALGETQLVLYDLDRGGAFDDWVLFDGTVLDGELSEGIVLGTINQVPVPPALLLLGSGLVGLLGLRRRMRD